MPTYVYECTQCGHEFEIFAKIRDRRRARKCTACGGRAVRKITGGAGFLFKGEGFYVTDYRSEEYRSKAKAEGEKSAETKSDEPKAETKPTHEARKTPKGKKAGKAGSTRGGDRSGD